MNLNLDDAVQDLAAALGRPVIVLGTGMKVIAYSMHDSDADRSRLALVIARSDTWDLAAAGAAHDRHGPHAVLLPAEGPLDARVVIRLHYEGRQVGHLLYFPDESAGDSPLTARARDEVERAASVIGELLALRLLDAKLHEDRAHRLLGWLLREDGTEHDRRRASAELIAEGLIEESGEYRVLVLRAPDPHPLSMTRLAVDKTMGFIERWTTVKVPGTIVGDEGVLLFPRRIDPGRLDRVMSTPGLEVIRAGVGGGRSTLELAVESFLEARLAWRAGLLSPESYGRAAFWDDMGVDKLLTRLPIESLVPNDLPRGVQRLLAASNSALLAETLESYLACSGDMTLTASRLAIHRSTLYYRLDRIREIVDCDLSDGNVRRDLHTGLRIARMAGHLPTSLG
ncbi:PucR-like helix-turn-helix protein [Actinomadura pelletieri DSM 43383]|uniref:PucR-like helix-turn-helix protein n=1 Tax=Actinomadura pelletieri DSM 43383 TaxID=1120940 RepID=A0A495QX42_9ACTN|nr:helix-turn-helix domain-containing protein [Actinomadura pelletieri]RKS78755.1 PucR-like helix-turn-helix protein [Actinomadura pelletieri DSM 43383]